MSRPETTVDQEVEIINLYVLLERDFDNFIEALTGQPYPVLATLRRILQRADPALHQRSAEINRLGLAVVERHMAVSAERLRENLRKLSEHPSAPDPVQPVSIEVPRGSSGKEARL